MNKTFMKNKIWMKHSKNQIDSQGFSEESHVGRYSQSINYTADRFFIDDDIAGPREYRDLVQCLLSAQEGDFIELVMSSGGGVVESALNIVSAIRESNAGVRAIITGSCHSAASLIALACDEVVVFDFAKMLCHSATFGSSGKTAEILSHVKSEEKYLQKIFSDLYRDFLSPKEITDLLEGKDFWFDAEEIRERLQIRSELQKKEQEKKMKELKKQQKQETPLANQTRKAAKILDECLDNNIKPVV